MSKSLEKHGTQQGDVIPMKRRVLVLGGSGMLGHKLVQVLGASSQFDLHCTVRRLPEAVLRCANAHYHSDIDVSRSIGELRRLVEQLQPDVIINAIGAVKQKDLSANLEQSFFVNGALPQLLPFLSQGAAAKVVHFSTDCVYKGTGGNYSEDDVPDAEDIYGRSKVIGEIAYSRHLTIRTSILGFELSGHLSLLSWLFSQPEGAVVPGYSSAIFSGLPTCTLARTVSTVLASESDIAGLYHIASEPIDKYALLTRIASAFALKVRVVPDEQVSIDRSLNDNRFRERTVTIRPCWDDLIAELQADYSTLPYQSLYERRRSLKH